LMAAGSQMAQWRKYAYHERCHKSGQPHNNRFERSRECQLR
jgi:hypothetical protein